MKCARILGILGVLALLIQSTASGQPVNPGDPPSIPSLAIFIIDSGVDNGDVVLDWTEIGLTPGSKVTYLFSGHCVATYACVAGKTGSVLGSVEADKTKGANISVSKKGTINQKALLDEPDPDPSMTCSGGQTLVLYQVVWTNVTVEDQGNNVSNTFPAPAGVEHKFCDLSANASRCPAPS